VLVWDNLDVHKAAGLREFPEVRDWLTIHYPPPYAPDLNPVEGIWSLLRRGWLSDIAFTNPEHLIQHIRRGLRHIRYRSDLMDGRLSSTDPLSGRRRTGTGSGEGPLEEGADQHDEPRVDELQQVEHRRGDDVVHGSSSARAQVS
jgi:hypothetical protein